MSIESLPEAPTFSALYSDDRLPPGARPGDKFEVRPYCDVTPNQVLQQISPSQRASLLSMMRQLP